MMGDLMKKSIESGWTFAVGALSTLVGNTMFTMMSGVYNSLAHGPEANAVKEEEYDEYPEEGEYVEEI